MTLDEMIQWIKARDMREDDEAEKIEAALRAGKQMREDFRNLNEWRGRNDLDR